jgi:hypothetical protein
VDQVVGLDLVPRKVFEMVDAECDRHFDQTTRNDHVDRSKAHYDRKLIITNNIKYELMIKISL